MEENKKLSEIFEELCEIIEQSGGVGFAHNQKNEYTKFISDLVKQNELLFKRSAYQSQIEYKANDIFSDEKDYIADFLILCENLLFNEITPKTTRFNEQKFNQLESKKIIQVNRANNEVLHYRLINKNLLEDEYYNVKYKVSLNNSINQYINTNNFGDISNSQMQVGNENIQNNNLNKEPVKINWWKRWLLFLVNNLVTIITGIVSGVIGGVLVLIIAKRLGL
ncbi:MAG: hypothetical protein ACK5LY_00200 [Lachnospirales bacterium]